MPPLRLDTKNQVAGGRGGSVSACADLTNQLILQCCWVDPTCPWKKH